MEVAIHSGATLHLAHSAPEPGSSDMDAVKVRGQVAEMIQVAVSRWQRCQVIHDL